MYGEPRLLETNTRKRGMMSRSTELHPAPMRVLVADDDDDMRALMVGTLRRDGYSVMEARDGGELLEMLRDAIDDEGTRPDIVVTDVRMPRLSGLGVLQELKRAHMHMPVIVVTVFGDDSMHVVARRLGAVGVLRKPFDVDDFRTAVVNASLALARDSVVPASS